MKVCFCDKGRVIKSNNINHDNTNKYFVIMKKTKKKVLKNSLSCFDYLTGSKNQTIINRINNDYSSTQIEEANTLKFLTKYFKMLAFSIYIFRKLKNSFKWLAFLSYTLEKLKYLRFLFWSYIPKKIQSFKKRWQFF